MSIPVVIRGGGDLASGVALRLHRAGIGLAILELEKPMAVRRTVSFAEAIYSGSIEIEGVIGRHAEKMEDCERIAYEGEIPVLIDPKGEYLKAQGPKAVVDARMTKRTPVNGFGGRQILIGLGPGFVAGENCDAVVETIRGHNLGRVFWQGSAQVDTGVPGTIASYNLDRVLRAPADGNVNAKVAIGDKLAGGDVVAIIGETELRTRFDGVLRGLVHPALRVHKGMKIGDIDPRNDPSYCWRVSDKALAIGGGVLEALLTRPEVRHQLLP
jgi:xanthine dehydrogenase accessory factor